MANRFFTNLLDLLPFARARAADVEANFGAVELGFDRVSAELVNYKDFSNRYLGAQAADPALDNEGSPLLPGAMYFNTDASELRIYSGIAWGRSAASSLSSTQVTFKLSAIGAILRSLFDKLSESVSVLDFGADPTGVLDSSPAFTAALAASKQVRVPKGTYLWKSTVNWTNGDAVVKCDSAAVIIPFATGTYTANAKGTYSRMLYASSINQIWLGGRFSLGNKALLCAIETGAYQAKVKDATFLNCELGVDLPGHSDYVTDNIFDHCAIAVRNIGTDANGNFIRGNTFEQCGTCVLLDNYTAGQIDSCFIESNLFNGYSAYGVLADAKGNDLHHLVIRGNYFETGAGTVAVQLFSSTTTGAFTMVQIAENIAFGATGSKFLLCGSTALATAALTRNSIFNFTDVVASAQSGTIELKGNTYTGTQSFINHSGILIQDDIGSNKWQRTVSVLGMLRPEYNGGSEFASSDVALTNVTNGLSIANGRLAGTVDGANNIGYMPDTFFRDSVSRYRAYIGDGWNANAIIRMDPQNTGNYYRIGVLQGGANTYIYFYRYTAGSVAATQNLQIAALTGRVVDFTVRAVGKAFTISAYQPGGSLLGSTTFYDSTYDAGCIGFFTNSSGGEAYIDSFRVGPQ